MIPSTPTPRAPEVQKKLCMLGSFAVGKTSLVARFVHSMFSERYHTTVGVRIDKKLVEPGRRVKLMLWDLQGEDVFRRVQTTYLRGAAGYVLVVDGTRRDTLAIAASLHERAVMALGPGTPFTLALNKADLDEHWQIDEPALDPWRARAAVITRTSAKTGAGVEEMLRELARRVAEPRARARP